LGKKCTATDKKILASRTRKGAGPRLTLLWGPRMVNNLQYPSKSILAFSNVYTASEQQNDCERFHASYTVGLYLFKLFLHSVLLF